MPDIPRYFKQQTIPGESGGVMVNPQMAGLPYEAGEKTGKTLMNIGEAASRYAVAEQRAERAVEAMRLESAMKNDFDIAAESYKQDADYKTYDTKVQGQIDAMRKAHIDPIEDKVLKQAAEKVFENQAYLLQKTVRDKKAQLITQEGQTQWDSYKQQAVVDYINTSDPVEKQRIIDSLTGTGDALVSSGVLHQKNVQQDIRNFYNKADETYIDRVMNLDPERAAKELRDPALFPNLDPKKREELIYRADERAYREEVRKEREGNLARKEIYDANGKEAFDRYLLWKNGKRAQDGVSFEDWLEENRASDNISEGTYQQHINRIERAKDRAVAVADKWTVPKRIQFGQIKQKFLDPSNSYSWSDIPGLVKGLPVSAADELSDILASQPSKERRQALRVSESFINKKLKEAEASPETWESTMAQWKYRAKDAPLENLQKIANEITAELPQGGLAAMMEEIKKKKGMKQEGNKPKLGPKQTQAATPQKGYRYSPVTGNFEEIK